MQSKAVSRVNRAGAHIAVLAVAGCTSLATRYPNQPTIYANNDDRYLSLPFGIDFRTEIHLRSSDQPGVSALACTEHKLKYQHQNTYPDRSGFEAEPGDFVTRA